MSEEILRLNALLTGINIRRVLKRNNITDQYCMEIWAIEIESIIKKLEEKQQTNKVA